MADQDSQPAAPPAAENPGTPPPVEATDKVAEQAIEDIDLFGDPNKEMSSQDIDNVIKEEDPAFMESMEKVAADKSISLAESNLSEADIEFLNEKESWQQSSGLGRFLFKIFPGVVKISLKIKKIRFRIFAFLRSLWVRGLNFAIYFSSAIKEFMAHGIRDLLGSLGKALTEFSQSWKKRTRRQKLIFSGSVLMGLIAAGILVTSWTRGIIPEDAELFVRQFDEFATESYEYDPATEVEPFFENLRTGLHVFHIEKIVVNVKRSRNSGVNPMAAFDFYIEGSSPDVLVEIKQKEIPVRDQIQRIIEGFTFDQLESGEGKKELTHDIEQELNAVLLSGRVRAVRIKTAIVKP